MMMKIIPSGREYLFISMPYSDFKTAKGRPVLVFKTIDKNDLLILPLRTNLEREGILINNDDISDDPLKKESVYIVPKLTVVDPYSWCD